MRKLFQLNPDAVMRACLPVGRSSRITSCLYFIFGVRGVPNNRDRLRTVAMDYLYSPAVKYQSLSIFTIIISEK
jgi:hypothetical protein